MTTVHHAPAGTDHTVIGAASGLLGQYRAAADEAFFASPTRTLLAEGVHARVPQDGRPLVDRVAETLARARRDGVEHPLVVGAVAFDHDSRAELAVPATLRTCGALRDDPLIALPAPAADRIDWDVRPVPAPEAYGAGVAEAVELLRADGELSKVVLSRTLELHADRPLDLPAILQRLGRRDPGGYTFAVPAGGGRTLIGASPELLLSRSGTAVVANPLAGSVPRSADLGEDVRRAAALLESPKDLQEHAFVVDAIHAALAPYCRDLAVPARPTLVRTAAMWHLATTITGELIDPDVSALELAVAMHPTPAVCGSPTPLAREAIRGIEPFDRGLYTGMVGWGDADGDGEWVVTLRCAEADERTLRVFAGAGVVAESRPESELAETSAKFRTFLDAAGVPQ
ncbi:isochorismate synthase DhbC [Kitasatospora purpeofusca]|uniref:isochorismate synthase DhbC n=1 Tax=Kitasatospora purpeofusca TaxID=67352 RepID=UPI002252BE32|nr:isochorismate synthase DhbC [Kitasatospora purpeofusca]MCX4688827.1 isochorismate synthase DhbC [Kitasatospora purpeofusca]